MSQPSILQSLGGPLGGQKFEFRGGNAMVGSAPDCAVRLEAPGVEGYHARIVIDITGATIYRVDGPVGVNDDAVTTDALLRSGDFVWIGEPGGPTSLMFQFTLGDVEEEAAPAPAPEAAPAPAPEAAPVVAAAVEEVGPEDLPAPEAAAPVEAPLPESAPPEAPVEQQELMEMAPEPVAGPEEVVEESQPEPAPEGAGEPMLLETAPEPVQSEPAAEPVAEIESVTEIESAFEPPPAFAQTAEVEHSFEAPAVEPAAPEPALSPAEVPVVPPETVVVPPAPWQMPAASTPEPAPAAEYASAWESPAAAPAPSTPEATVVLPATPPPAPPPPAPKPPAATQTRAPRPTPSTSTVAPKRPAAPGIKIRTVEQDKALRTPPPPPPPARTTSSMPIIVGGLVVLLVVAVGGFFMLRPSPAPVAPPTPAPTPVVVSTPAPTPEATPEATQVAEVVPTPEPTPEPVAPVAPTPRVAATPAPRTTPAPRATPTPRTTPTPTRPGAAAPTVAPTAAAPSAPVSQAPRLLDEARAAMTAKDLPKAAQLLGEVLRIEPGNAEAATRKAEVDARMASLAKKFVTGVTSVIGGKTAKGPSGFDLGGGGVVKTDFSAQIRCTTTPTSVDAGASYSIRCSILNIGAKAFRIEGITVNEVADGAKTAGAGVTPRGDIAPQADAVIVERVGTWSAKGSWSLEVIAKTTKDESFRAVYSWR